MIQKYILPPSVKRYNEHALTSMRCTKEISQPGMANYRKSRPLLKSANLSKSLLKLCNASDHFPKEIQNICR